MLASLAMLALKGALRVAPGGSAPLFPFAARRGSGGARSGRESRLADRTGKRVFSRTRLTMLRGDGSILVRQHPVRSGTFLDEAIRPLKIIVAGQSCPSLAVWAASCGVPSAFWPPAQGLSDAGEPW